MMTVDELRQQIAALPPVTGSSFWDTKRLELRQRIANDDPTQFLRWPTITSTMYVGDAPFVEIERNEIQEQYYPFLQEPAMGNPSSINANYTHQFYHLHRFEKQTDWRIQELETIVEVGGGYGAMAVLCHRLGFVGNYRIVDLPEFVLLQQWYLSHILSDISWITWGYLDNNDDCDLLIACHSLSEMPISEREKILRVDANSYLFVYHCEHDGVDNLHYFTDFAKRTMQKFEWTHRLTEHLPNQRYSIGVRL